MRTDRSRGISVRRHDRSPTSLEPLEPRVILDAAGYFAAGVQYNGDTTIFREFGEFEDTDGEINFAVRETPDGSGFSPWAGFDLHGAMAMHESSIRFKTDDEYNSRVTVGFGSTSFGFTVGYSSDDYDVPADVSYLMRQAAGLGTGSGGRDGTYFFNGVVQNVNTGAWMFNYGTTTISGLEFQGSQMFETGEVPFSYTLDPSGIFADGYTTFSDSTSVGFFGSDLRFALQTDLDGSDGFRSYSLGFRTQPDTSFTNDDFAGDIYALSLTGSSILGDFFGLSGGSSDAFTYTGALEFADGGTFRMYDLRDLYALGRDGSTPLMTGGFSITGDEVRLSSLDGSRTADLKFNPDLSLGVGLRYSLSGNDYHVFGGGPRILDGDTGDFPAVDGGGGGGGGGGGEEPTVYNFRSVVPLVGLGGEHFLIAETDDEDVRFDVRAVSGLSFNGLGLSAWLTDEGSGLEAVGVTDAGVQYIQRSADGLWTSGLLSSAPEEVFATRPAFGMLVGGGMSLGGFNASGDLVRYDCVDDLWSIDVFTGIPAPDGAAETPTDAASLLVAPWGAWHLFYLDSVGDLRATWTAPGLDTYYDNNLSLRAGMDPIDGTGLDVTVTDWASIHVGVVDQNALHGVWWQPVFQGDWVDTDFADVLGTDGAGLSSDFVGAYFDRPTGDLYKFAITDDQSDVVIYRVPLGGGWQRHEVLGTLGVSGLTVPEPSTIVVGGLLDGGENVSLHGGVPGLDNLPIVSRLFTSRTAEERNQSLLVFLHANLAEPIDDE